MRPFFQKAVDQSSGVQGLLGLASFHLNDRHPDSVIRKLHSAKGATAENLYREIRDSELSRNESDLLVFLSGGFPYEAKLLHALLGDDDNLKAEAREILESWVCGNPDFPYVPLIQPTDFRIRSNPSAKKPQTHRATAILVGGLASAALISANSILRQ